MDLGILVILGQLWSVSIFGMKKLGNFMLFNPIFRAPFFSKLDLKSRKSMWTYDILKTRFCIFLKTIKMDLRLF